MEQYSIRLPGDYYAPGTGLSEELFRRFISYIDVKPSSVATYTRAIQQFFKWLHVHTISSPQRTDILAFRDDLRNKGLKPTTIQSYIIAIRQFFKWTAQEGLYKNVADNIKGAKLTAEHKKDVLTSAQAKIIFQSMDTATIIGKRDFAIMALMLTGGLRTIEVARANVEDLRPLSDDMVLYIQGKGQDERTDYVKVVPEVEQAIRAYLQERGSASDSAPLFASHSDRNLGQRMTAVSISRIVKTAFRKAGFDSHRLTAHSLRHTAGTLNLICGGTLEETQQLLRHSKISTTMIYLHHLDRAKNNSELRIARAIF